MPSALLAERQPRPAAYQRAGWPGLRELDACRQGHAGPMAGIGEGMLRRPGSLCLPLQSQGLQKGIKGEHQGRTAYGHPIIECFSILPKISHTSLT